MANTNNLDPKLYAEIIDRVKNGQPLNDLLSKYDPETIRDILENATANFSGKTPVSELYEKPELFKNIKTKIDPKMSDHGKINYYEDPKTGLALPEEGITKTLKNPLDKATDLHESQHAYDILSQPNVKQPIELSSRSILPGLEEATASMASHFKPDAEGKFDKLKQLVNLENVVKGNPLKVVAPLAIGAAALGVGQKAMAGDTRGAALDAADQGSYFIPGIGEARVAGDLSMGELGKEPTDPVSMEGSVFNNDEDMKPKARFNKTKQLLSK